MLAVSAALDVDARVVTFTFDHAIAVTSVAATDLQVTNLTTPSASASATSATVSADGKTLTFGLPATLADGNYRFRVPIGAISTVNGVATATNVDLVGPGTFILAGDANRDRSVSFDDLLILGRSYTQSGRSFSNGNFDYSADGKVDFDDLLVLARHFSASLAPIATADTVLTNANPFGVASSYQSTGTYPSWASSVAQAGVKWVRLFPQWNDIEPSPGVFNFSSIDAITDAAAANHQYVSGMLYYDAAWVNANLGTFPTSNLAAWSDYVSAVVAHTAGKVEHWEVWNEPQTFAPSGTPQDYAKIVVSAYNAATAVDPNVRIGLDVASVDVNYLKQAIQAGAADHFDYVTVHPYETLGNIDQGWEAVYMSIVPTLRKMLAATDPARANVPIWFTELGEQIGFVNGPQSVTSITQAQDLVKAYTMGIAQGVARIDWYEGKDGDSGFGLLDASGNPRFAYTAMRSLTSALGTSPQSLGWLRFNGGADKAFVFQGATTSVMAAWAPLHASDSITFSADVQVVNPLTGLAALLPAGMPLALTDAPVLILSVPAELLSQAQANKGSPFPWGGDYGNASSVSIQMGSENVESGLHQLNANQTSKPVIVGGGLARLSNDSDADVYQTFEVDPNFISYGTSTLSITVVARRATDGPAGFNVGYESATGFQHNTASGWWAIPGNDQWYTRTFTITDAEFDSKYGYNFSIHSDSPSNGAFYIQSVTVTRG